MQESFTDNVDAQQKALAAVAARPTLTRLIPAAGAYGLGVIPLARTDDGLSVATFPRICPGALAALRRHVGAPVLPVEFDENVMAFFVDKIYLQGQGVNIHTFRSPDFLDDPASDQKLFSPKIEQPEARGSLLPAGDIVLADLSLSSEIHNLDVPRPAGLDNYRLGEFCPAFRNDGGTWTVWAEQPLAPEVPLILQVAEDYGGEEFFRDLSAIAVREWPAILFPSEIQVLGVGEDGALALYLDGSTHSIAPGTADTYRTEYWLVRHGWRFHRRLSVHAHAVARVPRATIRYASPFQGAGAAELRRWLFPGDESRAGGPA